VGGRRVQRHRRLPIGRGPYDRGIAERTHARAQRPQPARRRRHFETRPRTARAVRAAAAQPARQARRDPRAGSTTPKKSCRTCTWMRGAPTSAFEVPSSQASPTAHGPECSDLAATLNEYAHALPVGVVGGNVLQSFAHESRRVRRGTRS
jgi:hypothetical protein